MKRVLPAWPFVRQYARLLGLDEEPMHNAIGLAGLQGAGLQEMLHSAQEVKPLQPLRDAILNVLRS